MLTLSKFVWPSTSKSPPTLTFFTTPTPPATLNAPVVVFVDWVPAFMTTTPVVVVAPPTFTLSKFVWPSTSSSTKSPLPTNVVAVTTPAIETLSKFVCPSTSKSWVTVVKPAMFTLSRFNSW